MFENIFAFFQVVGFLFLTACVFVGGYIWLRWGAAGVEIIWKRRREIDIQAMEEFEERWKR
jgi:hypothetical protein